MWPYRQLHYHFTSWCHVDYRHHYHRSQHLVWVDAQVAPALRAVPVRVIGSAIHPISPTTIRSSYDRIRSCADAVGKVGG